MKKTLFIVLTLIFFNTPVFAKIDLSGAIRNDAMMLFQGSDRLFVNLLETKLFFQRKTAEWKFYSDLRVSLYTSEQLSQAMELPEEIDPIDAELLRTFIKIYSDYGDITLGKTYVNFGIMSVFNPFELDQNLDVSDLSGTKAGLVALTYDFELNDLTVGKLYVSPEASAGDVSFGGALSSNLGSFDTGVVINHLGQNDNLVGMFFKGDLEVGVQGSWAYHWDDQGGSNFSEFVAGVDYSFFDGKLLASCMGYINGAGITEPSNLGVFLSPTSEQSGESFAGKAYIYGQLSYSPDEFLQWSVNGFVYTLDQSSLIVPAVQMVIADGLTISAQCIFPTGVGHAQYSRDVYGDAIAVVRLEAKL